VFLSSHLMSEMAKTADHLIVIGRGHIIADAGTEEFINRHTAASVRVRAVEQADLAETLAQRGALIECGPDGAMVVTGMDSTAIGRSRSRSRHHPRRAGPTRVVARRGVFRPDEGPNRLPRRPAGRRNQRSLT